MFCISPHLSLCIINMLFMNLVLTELFILWVGGLNTKMITQWSDFDIPMALTLCLRVQLFPHTQPTVGEKWTVQHFKSEHMHLMTQGLSQLTEDNTWKCIAMSGYCQYITGYSRAGTVGVVVSMLPRGSILNANGNCCSLHHQRLQVQRERLRHKDAEWPGYPEPWNQTKGSTTHYDVQCGEWTITSTTSIKLFTTSGTEKESKNPNSFKGLYSGYHCYRQTGI